jgi:flagellar biosynthetic protein FliR
MVSLQSILTHVPQALLVIFRIGGLMVYGPVFGSSMIPARIRIFLSFVLGLAIYPLLSISIFQSNHLQLNLWMLAPVLAMELLIGLIIGFVANLPIQALQTGGVIMGQQMGLGFSQLYNPTVDDEADVIGQMLIFMGLATFLAIGGCESLLLAMMHSFEHVPLGGFAVHSDFIALVCGLLLTSIEFALRISAPLLALVFLETVAMGFLAKTVPQLNILSLGFPIRIIVGLIIMSAGLVVINDVTGSHMQQTLTSLFDWIEGFSLKAA